MNVLNIAGYHMPLLVVELLGCSEFFTLAAQSGSFSMFQCCCAMLWIVHSVETMDLFCGDDRLKI